MMIKVNNEVISGALKKVSVCLKDTVSMTVTTKELQGKKIANVAACDGSNQANITFTCECDSPEQVQLIFGKELVSTVEVLSKFDTGEDICIKVSDGAALLTCGKAEVSLGLLADTTALQVLNPKEHEHAQVIFETEKLQKAVGLGAISVKPALDGRFAVLQNALYFGFDDGKAKIASSDGVLCTAATSEIKAVQGELKFNYSLNADVFSKVVLASKTGEIMMFLLEKQVVIREGNDFYIITPNATPIPDAVVTGVYAAPRDGFSMVVDKAKLLSAIEIAMLSGEQEAKKTVYCLEEKTLTVSSLKKANKVDLAAENAKGAVTVGLDGSAVKKLVSKLGGSIRLEGSTAVAPVFISDGTDGFAAMLAPINIADTEEEE